VVNYNSLKFGAYDFDDAPTMSDSINTCTTMKQTTAMHESRLEKALRELLLQRSVAALGTVSSDGGPFVSMVPWAIESESADLILHVSALAAHTRQMQADPRVSLLVMAAPDPSTPVQALSRVTMSGLAQALGPQSASWLKAREAYLHRFPETESIMALPDFSFIAIHVLGARHVAGFGTARDVSREEMCRVLGHPSISQS
jgi:putative heme iron utilization protein